MRRTARLQLSPAELLLRSSSGAGWRRARPVGGPVPRSCGRYAPSAASAVTRTPLHHRGSNPCGPYSYPFVDLCRPALRGHGIPGAPPVCTPDTPGTVPGSRSAILFTISAVRATPLPRPPVPAPVSSDRGCDLRKCRLQGDWPHHEKRHDPSVVVTRSRALPASRVLNAFRGSLPGRCFAFRYVASRSHFPCDRYVADRVRHPQRCRTSTCVCARGEIQVRKEPTRRYVVSPLCGLC